MSSGSTKPPKAPDPVLMAELQDRANRPNINSQFGSSMWSTGADGRATQTNTLSPGLQGNYDRAQQISSMGPEGSQRWQAPQGLDQLTGLIGNRVANNYGANQPAKPQQQRMQNPSMKPPQQGGSIAGPRQGG